MTAGRYRQSTDRVCFYATCSLAACQPDAGDLEVGVSGPREREPEPLHATGPTDSAIPQGPDGQETTSSPTAPPLPQVRVATGFRRVLYVVAGLCCVGMAYLGAILPGLPTTPWVLLASYCFGRSSPRLQRWLRRSPLFGRLLRDWEDHGGIRKPVKIFAVCLIVIVVSISILSGRLPVWVRWVIGGCALCGVCTIVFVVPTVRGGPRDT